MYKKISLIVLFFFFSLSYAQFETNYSNLQQFSNQKRMEWKNERAQAESLAVLLGIPIKQVDHNGIAIELQRFKNGVPIYYMTNNLNAAKTISTDDVWPNGSTGFDLDGNGMKLGIWDEGKVRNTHQEFGSRVTQKDNVSTLSNHSTHVAGTMIAKGQDPAAKGMAFRASLDAYDWNGDESEMAAAAANDLLISNHSYGHLTGWYWGDLLNKGYDAWYWFGDVNISQTEDYRFGFYSSEASDWDQIAFDAPY